MTQGLLSRIWTPCIYNTSRAHHTERGHTRPIIQNRRHLERNRVLCSKKNYLIKSYSDYSNILL
uniref:Uncharacterized protein n=1 Tax=Arundo donax TaxID=35708 RepID=A0A0A9DXC1_ARUDO